MAVSKPHLRADEQIRQGLEDFHSTGDAEQPCTRLECGGKIYVIPPDLSGLITGLQDLRLFDYFPLNGRVNFVYGLKERHTEEGKMLSGLKEMFLDELPERLRVIIDNLYHGDYRSDYRDCAHAAEHEIERSHRG